MVLTISYKKKLKNIFSKTAYKSVCIVLAAFLCITSAFVAGASISKEKNKSLYDKILEEKGFIYGVNSPWIFGANIGGSTLNEIKTGTRTHVSPVDDYRRVLTNCKAIGYDAVKIWLFQNMEGIKVAETGEILGFDEFFMDDLTAILDIAQQLGIALDFTLLPHQETLMKAEYGHGVDSQYLYNRLTQFVVNPKYRKTYIDRVVAPVCELIDEKYRDTVLSLTVYCEPEGDTYGEGDAVSNNYLYGTSWENLVEFINDVTDFIHENLPQIPVTATSGWNPYKMYRYNDTNLDIFGVDVYNDVGNLPDPETMNVDRPMWLTEFGAAYEDGYNHSDDFQIQYMLEFYNNAIAKGYTGGFFWTFNGSAPQSITYRSNTYSALRPIAAVMHYRFIDEENARKGIEAGTVADKPALLYGDDSLTLQWIASRDAAKYKIEVSYDGGKTYSKYADITDADTVTGPTNACSYDISAVKQNVNATFRISVETYDGLKATSDPLTLFMPKFTCSDDENLIKNGGFENGLDGWTYNECCITAVEKSDGVTTHRGDKAALLPGDRDNHQWHNLYQTVTLKPNTTYRVTFYSNHLWDTYTKNFKVAKKGSSTNIIEEKMAVGNDYTINTYTFTTDGTQSDYCVYFVNNYEPIYVDSVYLFEIAE